MHRADLGDTQIHLPAGSHFGAFDNNLGGKHEKQTHKNPDNIADNYRQASNRERWNRKPNVPPDAERNGDSLKSECDSHART